MRKCNSISPEHRFAKLSFATGYYDTFPLTNDNVIKNRVITREVISHNRHVQLARGFRHVPSSSGETFPIYGHMCHGLADSLNYSRTHAYVSGVLKSVNAFAFKKVKKKRENRLYSFVYCTFRPPHTSSSSRIERCRSLASHRSAYDSKCRRYPNISAQKGGNLNS